MPAAEAINRNRSTETTMILIKNLLTTDYGLLSLGVIVGVLVIGWWLSRWFQQNMERDAANEASRNK